MFSIATRNRFRFDYKGTLSVEDLWDLTLSELDYIYQKLNVALKSVSNTESLIKPKPTAEINAIEAKVSVVKHIFDVLSAEAIARASAAAKKVQRNKILEIMASKQDDELKNKSLAELTALLDQE